MKRCRPLLGTFVEIEAEGLSEGALSAAIERAFDAVALVHKLMSFHDPASELSALNRLAAFETVSVHPWTAKVLKWALILYRETKGLFDPVVGCELIGRGFLPEVGHAVIPGTMSQVRLGAEGRVRYDGAFALDLGGIAKGFAVDCAVASLRACGAKSAIVNAGGDLRVFGPEPRPIAIRHPDNPASLAANGYLQNGAVATSSAVATLVETGEGPASALVWSRSRAPITSRSAYTVLSPTCVVADGLTKALAQTAQLDAPWLRRLGAIGLITSSAAAT